MHMIHKSINAYLSQNKSIYSVKVRYTKLFSDLLSTLSKQYANQGLKIETHGLGFPMQTEEYPNF